MKVTIFKANEHQILKFSLPFKRYYKIYILVFLLLILIVEYTIKKDKAVNFFNATLSYSKTMDEKKLDNMISISNNKYSVSLIGIKPDKQITYLNKFIFEIINKDSKKVSQFSWNGVQSRARSIKNFHFIENNRLLIEGRLKRADTSCIVDLRNNKLIEEFWSYRLSISPSKRFLVYEKFFPYHGLPGSATTVVLIYDLNRTPDKNRMIVRGYDAAVVEVGIAIYPEPYVKAKAYVLPKQQQQNPFWYSLNSPFLWAEDESCIIFLCNHKKQTYIVRVDISSGIKKPKIFESPVIITDEFIKPKYKKGVELDIQRNKKFLHTVSATDIYWEDPDHIIIKPSKGSYHLKEKIRILVP